MVSAKLAVIIIVCVSGVYSFTCPDDSHNFYHADVSTGCQVYHLCQNSQMQTLNCPSGKAFNHATSQCEDASSVDCYETLHHHHMHHHHKRSLEEYHTIEIVSIKNKAIEMYHAIKPMVVSAFKDITPSIYSEFEEDYLQSFRSFKNDVMPIFHEKIWPQIQKIYGFSVRTAARFVEKAYKAYELSNSTHITYVSMSDLATDVSNDLQPVIKLGRYISARLLQHTRAKRSSNSDDITGLLSSFVEPLVKNIFSSVGATFTGQENTVTSKVILPILYKMMEDSETRFDLMRIWFSAKSAFAPVMWEILSRQTYNTPEGTIIKVPRATYEAAKYKFQVNTKPIIQKIFRKHLSMMLIKASQNIPLILHSIDILKNAKNAHSGVLKDAILNFIAKHGSLLKTSSSKYIHTYTMTEIKKDLKPIYITLLQVWMDYFSKSPNSWVNVFFDRDSYIYKSLLGSTEYARPAPATLYRRRIASKNIAYRNAGK